MPKFQFRVEGTPDAMKGVIGEGVPGRMENVKGVVESLGGTFEGYYFVAGTGNTAILFVQFADLERATALALAISASGAGAVRFEQLMTPEEAQRSVELLPSYRAPGAEVAFDPWR